MAASSLNLCNPTTTWYDFAYTLSWSNECEVAEVLSDIPFISVGILVFCVSTLFLVMKRVSISAVWLFFSALLVFIAALLDLGQTLANGMATNTTLIANLPVIKTREVLFALSLACRFLFYWSYVAEPPTKDVSALSTQTVQGIKFLTLDRTHEFHSGSWTRWGLPGRLLGVGLLVAIIIITALQIVWRVVPQFHQYSSVYGADVALELVVSFLLLLKLLSNTLTLNSPANMLVHTSRESIAPISGLLVNIAIGVGDLLCFAFTESTVGRLLQAFEVYVMVVFVVIAAFLRHRNILLYAVPLQRRECRDVAFTLPTPTRESTFRLTLPLIETPRMSTIFGNVIQNKQSSREAFSRSARYSLNHVSSWVSSRVSRVSRNRAHHEDEEVGLWSAKKVRAGPSRTRRNERDPSFASSTQERTELAGPRDASATHMSIASALNAHPVLARSTEGSIHSDEILHSSRADVVPRTIQARKTSVPVSYLPSPISKRTECIGAIPKASPVYSLTGIQSGASPSESRTSLDELLRQQSQLDRSIDVLKLFSARPPTNSLHSNPATTSINVELARSPSTGQRTVSSEVSLSSFPSPPWLMVPVPSIPSSSSSSIKRIRGNRRARLAAAQPTLAQKTSISPTLSASSVDMPSSPHFNNIPHSPFGDENECISAEANKTYRSDSGGTQYNVTSFIDGLATPNEPRPGSQEEHWLSTQKETCAGAVRTDSGMKKLTPHILPAPRRIEGMSAPPAVVALSPLGCSSKLVKVDKPAGDVSCRTNDQIPMAPSAQIFSTDQAENGTAIPPTRPQADLSTTMSPEGADRVQRTLVRPRPPPLIINTEQNPAMLRVQVLADD